MRSPYERRAQKELEADGWIVDNKAGMGRFARNRDFWNRFDLVAVKKGQPMRWISIKGRAGAPKAHREEVESFWMPEGNLKEIWMRRRGKGDYWRKLTYE